VELMYLLMFMDICRGCAACAGASLSLGRTWAMKAYIRPIDLDRLYLRRLSLLEDLHYYNYMKAKGMLNHNGWMTDNTQGVDVLTES